MGHGDPVTTDWQVARAMAGDDHGEKELCWLSSEIAETLSITVFQITARLKGMEGRGITERHEGYWRLTPLGFQLGAGDEPPRKEQVPLGERVYRTPTGGYYTPGAGAAALPDDSSVPHRSAEDAHGWRMRKEYGPRHPEVGVSISFIEIFIDRDGTEWVRCAPTEIAELICGETALSQGLSPVRLRRRTGSTAAERRHQNVTDKVDDLMEHINIQKKVKRKQYA